MNAPAEKIAGTDLTPIAEYTETAMALAELQSRYKGLVVDVSTPKGLKEAKACTFELRTLRTALEKKRAELKAPILARGKMLDDEAKRITAEIRALEEPIDVQIKAEEARVESERLAKLEAERQRVEAIQQKIQQIRDVPGSLVGKPSVIIAGQLANLEAEQLDEDEFAEHFVTARDALDAAIARVKQLLADQQAHEAEQKRIAAEREELARMREENERLQREAEERRLVDERRAAEERFEAERKERERVDAIRSRIDGIRCMAVNLDGLGSGELTETRQALRTMHPAISGADFAEFKNQALDVWDAAEATLSSAIERREQEEESARQEAERRAEEDRRLQAERDRQAAEQKKLDEQAAQLKRDQQAAAAKAEADRLANLGLREAAQAVVDHFDGQIKPKCVFDLAAALANDAAAAKPARTKRAARA